MRRIALLFAVMGLATLTSAQVHFDSGSDGSDGALNVPVSTTLILNMDDSPDGIFQYTDVLIEGTLQIERNENNTPPRHARPE